MKRMGFLRSILPSIGFAIAATTAASVAFAGPAYVDSTRFAVSGRDVVAYFSLPANGRSVQAVPGRAQFTTEWNGARYAFSTDANRQAFIADPQRYAPQFDGHCAFAAGEGYKAPASPNAWRIIDGKLYLNYSLAIQRKWSPRASASISAGEANWKTLGEQAAATGDAADYRPKDAPKP
jgi:YHS domain-containing protein